MNTFLQKIKRRLFGSKPKRSHEDEYYAKLFIENKKWNNPNPNEEEEKRWDVIKHFIESVITERKAKAITTKPAILDVGCGRGWLSNLLSQYGNVTGIEPVAKVVAFGKTLFPGLDLRSGTTKELLKKPGYAKYDIIVSSEVLEHIPDEGKNDFINDLNLLLNPGGFLILTTPRNEAQSEWLKFSAPGQPVEDWIDEKTLEGLLHNNNFETRLLKRLADRPSGTAPEIEVYQLWLFQKKSVAK